MQKISELKHLDGLPIATAPPVIPELNSFDSLIPHAVQRLRPLYRTMIALSCVDAESLGVQGFCARQEQRQRGETINSIITLGQHVVVDVNTKYHAGVVTKVTKTKVHISVMTHANIERATRNRPYDPATMTAAEYAHEVALLDQYRKVLNPREFWYGKVKQGVEGLYQERLAKYEPGCTKANEEMAHLYRQWAQQEYGRALKRYAQYDRLFPEQVYIDTYVHTAALAELTADPRIGIAAWAKVNTVSRDAEWVYAFSTNLEQA